MLHPDYKEQSMVDNLITFGWAKDYRTYALCLLIFVSALYNFFSGDVSMKAFADQFIELALGPAGMAMRAGMKK